jgi:hypothetical protein
MTTVSIVWETEMEGWIPHVTFVAPMETEVLWDGTSAGAFLEVFRDTMASDCSFTIADTIFACTFTTIISHLNNEDKNDMLKT